MNDNDVSRDIFIALIRLREKSALFIEKNNWEDIKEKFEQRLEQLLYSEDAETRNILIIELLDMLKSYQNAAAYLKMELDSINQQSIYLKTQVSALSNTGFADEILDQSISILLLALEPSRTRTIVINTGGQGGATSKKLGNIELSLKELIPIVSSLPLFGAATFEAIAFGLLAFSIAVDAAMTDKLDEHEASVFWGCIMGKNQHDLIEEANIVQLTNDERQLVGLPSLTSGEVRNALNKLSNLKSIQRTDDKTWRVVESYRIVFLD